MLKPISLTPLASPQKRESDPSNSYNQSLVHTYRTFFYDSLQWDCVQALCKCLKHCRTYQDLDTIPKRVFLDWLVDLIKKTDESTALKLFQNPQSDTPREIIASMQITVDFMKIANREDLQKSVQTTLTKLQTCMITRARYIKELSDLYKAEAERKFKQKTPSQLQADFNLYNRETHTSLTDEKTERLVFYCSQVDQHRDALMIQSDFELKQALNTLRPKLASQSSLNQDSFYALAILSEVLRRHSGFLPYNTQMMTILGLLHLASTKGCLAQVGTGEGKSTITAILIGFHALKGKTVDVITSSSSLAKRDYEVYHYFYSFFSASSSHICYEHPVPEHFQADILYGTNTDFEFAYLRDAIFKTGLLKNKHGVQRKKQVVIVDEVDNLLIDMATQHARIAYPTKSYFLPLFQFIYKEVFNKTALSLDPDAFYEKLTQNPIASSRDGNVLVTKQQFNAWVESAKVACFEFKKDIHYIVYDEQSDSTKGSKKSIKIVDYRNTGKISHGSRWSNGLHAFVELHNGLVPEQEQFTIGEICHPIFFDMYETLFGLSGTIGNHTERDEIAETYQVSIFNVPPHLEKKSQEAPLAFYNSEHDFLLELEKEIHTFQAANRPVLILCISMQKVQCILTHLNQKKIGCIQPLTDSQEMEEGFIISRIGRPGSITVATNTASRGTDAVLDKRSLEAGGLHVIVTYFPENERVETQAIGRQARQGQPGTYRFMIAMDDLSLKPYQPLVQLWTILGQTPDIMGQLRRMREHILTTQSNHRKDMVKIAKVKQNLLYKFYNFISNLDEKCYYKYKSVIFEKWSDCYQTLEYLDNVDHCYCDEDAFFENFLSILPKSLVCEPGP